MKKTAVEWLVEQYNLGNGFERLLIIEQFNQAKEMEKEQIETAFEEGMFHHTNGLCPNEYYKETFKSE